MTTSEIEIILEKYFDGETSVKEENILRDFFQEENVPDSLKKYQAIFIYYKQTRDETIIKEPQTIPLYPLKNRIVYISSLAAGVLLVIGLFFTFLNDYSRNNQLYKTNEEAKVALLQAESALLLVSGNLNNGLHHVQKLESLNKAISNMQMISKFSQYQPLIINPDETKNESQKSK